VADEHHLERQYGTLEIAHIGAFEHRQDTMPHVAAPQTILCQDAVAHFFAAVAVHINAFAKDDGLAG
jgi:hypothetical protein